MFAQGLLTLILLSLALLFGWKFCLKPAFFPDKGPVGSDSPEVLALEETLRELQDKKLKLEASKELVDVATAVRGIEEEQNKVNEELNKLKNVK